MSTVQTLLAFVVALGVLVFVHELGHYLAARWCGVKVLRFAVGFGYPVARFVAGKDRTEWRVGLIPFGGYVKMLDVSDGPVSPEEAHRSFDRQSPWRRMFIVAAGPAANFGFAILIYLILNTVGVPDMKTVVSAPAPGTAAAAAGIRESDEVVSIAGEPVSGWQELRWQLLRIRLSSAEAVDVGVLRQGSTQVSVLTLALGGAGQMSLDDDFFERVGLRAFRPALAPVIGQISENSPATAAGLLRGDRVLRANGIDVDGWDALVGLVRASPGVELRLTIERDGRSLEIPVRPAAVAIRGTEIGRIGAGPLVPPDYAAQFRIVNAYSPAEALSRAVRRTVELSAFTLRSLGMMITGDISFRHLSGPVAIADYAGQSAQLGWVPYLAFIALISVSLGILNLLPVPVLDGGHLLYYLVEIFRGKPISVRTLEFAQKIGLFVLVSAMALALYNDINRLLVG